METQKRGCIVENVEQDTGYVAVLRELQSQILFVNRNEIRSLLDWKFQYAAIHPRDVSANVTVVTTILRPDVRPIRSQLIQQHPSGLRGLARVRI